MHMQYSSERQKVATQLAPVIVDPENVYAHLLPFIACESPPTRQTILDAVTSNAS